MTPPTDPRTRYALDSQDELRGAFLDVFAAECPDVFADLWRDRDAHAWAARHGLTDAWLVEAARATVDAAGSARLSTFFLDLPVDGGWTRETNAAGLERPARPVMPAATEPGGLVRFLARDRKYRERLARWAGTAPRRRWQVSPAHLQWTAHRLAGRTWAQLAEGAGVADVRTLRRKVAAVAKAIGLSLR